MPTPTRIVMFGTGDFALPTFELLLSTGHNLVGLVTQPDRPQGRKLQLIPSRIKVAAEAAGVPIFQPERVNDPESLAVIRQFVPDLFVTAAYGQILSADLLAIPQGGGINLHGSLLPSYRGAAPVARAIQNGEATSGVTVIRMTPRVDAGGMLDRAPTPIDPDETADELEARLAIIGAPLIVEAVDRLAARTAEFLPQSKGQVTKAPKLGKEDGRIDWSRPARTVHDLVRSMQSWPGAFTTWHKDRAGGPVERLIVHKTALIEGATDALPGTVVEGLGDRFVVAADPGLVRLLVVQPVGRKTMPAADFLRGHPLLGERLGD